MTAGLWVFGMPCLGQPCRCFADALSTCLNRWPQTGGSQCLGCRQQRDENRKFQTDGPIRLNRPANQTPKASVVATPWSTRAQVRPSPDYLLLKSGYPKLMTPESVLWLWVSPMVKLAISKSENPMESRNQGASGFRIGAPVPGIQENRSRVWRKVVDRLGSTALASAPY